MDKPKAIMFCVPTHTGQVATPFVASCLNMVSVLYRIGLLHCWNWGVGESLIQRARNGMVTTFLEGDCSHLMWIDCDIEFTPDDIAAVWNLCEGETQADIAVGAYAIKREDKNWRVVYLNNTDQVTDLSNYDKPVEVTHAGTGFMLIKRKVIETLKEKRGTYGSHDSRREPAIFMSPVHDDQIESEDYHFCRIARENGFKIWMDPTVRLGHYGLYRYGAN